MTQFVRYNDSLQVFRQIAVDHNHLLARLAQIESLAGAGKFAHRGEQHRNFHGAAEAIDIAFIVLAENSTNFLTDCGDRHDIYSSSFLCPKFSLASSLQVTDAVITA